MPGLDQAADAAAPAAWTAIAERTAELGFDMPSEPRTGMFLRMLAASKPCGRLLELGTGTGLATAWLLAGMSRDARLVSVDVDAGPQAVARTALANDPRVEFVTADGLEFVRAQPAATYDLVFADALPGKYEGLHEALALVRPGGFWVGDDMLPQPNWPDGHETRVADLLAELRELQGWTVAELAWASGLVVAVRCAETH